MSQIIPKFWLGNWNDANDLKFLEANNIKCVISVCDHIKPTGTLEGYHRLGIWHLVVAIFDTELSNIGNKLVDITNVIGRHYDPAQNEGILVHCMAGISRSTTIVCAYLIRCNYPVTIKADVENYVDAVIRFVRSRRPIIEPNQGFRMQLYNFLLKIKNKEITSMEILLV
jgi:protein-tyrosine phosphatase